MYIYDTPNESGSFPALNSEQSEGMLEFPIQYEQMFYDNNGFVILTINNGIIIDCQPNTASRTSWLDSIADELAIKAKKDKIAECKAELAELDYIGVKIATGRATVEEYATQIDKMNELAEEINQLESELESYKGEIE